MRAMCGVKFMDGKTAKGFMQKLGLKEASDQLAEANNACWYLCVSIRRDRHIFTKTLHFEEKDKSKAGPRKLDTQVGEDSIMCESHKVLQAD